MLASAARLNHELTIASNAPFDRLGILAVSFPRATMSATFSADALSRALCAAEIGRLGTSGENDAVVGFTEREILIERGDFYLKCF